MDRPGDLRLLPCLNCGLPAEAHVLIDCGTYLTDDGATIRNFQLAGIDGDQYGVCPGWDPDTMPHVTGLLGLDVRRAIL